MQTNLQTYRQLNAADARPERDPFTRTRYRQFSRYLPDKARVVLDVGCHSGRGGVVLKQVRPSLQLIGLDCVVSHLERVPSRVYRQLLCCSATRIALQDGTVDAIVAGEFVEHIYSQEVPQALREFFRILRPGGRLLLTTPNPGFVLLKARGARVIGGPHVSEHRPEELARALESAGFDHIRIAGSGMVSSLLGQRFPLFCCYGSYLASADVFPKTLQ